MFLEVNILFIISDLSLPVVNGKRVHICVEKEHPFIRFRKVWDDLDYRSSFFTLHLNFSSSSIVVKVYESACGTYPSTVIHPNAPAYDSGERHFFFHGLLHSCRDPLVWLGRDNIVDFQMVVGGSTKSVSA